MHKGKEEKREERWKLRQCFPALHIIQKPSFVWFVHEEKRRKEKRGKRGKGAQCFPIYLFKRLSVEECFRIYLFKRIYQAFSIPLSGLYMKKKRGKEGKKEGRRALFPFPASIFSPSGLCTKKKEKRRRGGGERGRSESSVSLPCLIFNGLSVSLAWLGILMPCNMRRGKDK